MERFEGFLYRLSWTAVILGGVLVALAAGAGLMLWGGM